MNGGFFIILIPERKTWKSRTDEKLYAQKF